MATKKSATGGGLMPWLGMALIIILLDQISKIVVIGAFELHDSRPLTSFFNLVRVHNEGAAFSFLAGYFALRQAHPVAAWCWLASVVVLGAVFGAGQTLRGAHYPSHTLWTAWICLAATAASHHGWLAWRARGDAAAR